MVQSHQRRFREYGSSKNRGATNPVTPLKSDSDAELAPTCSKWVLAFLIGWPGHRLLPSGRKYHEILGGSRYVKCFPRMECFLRASKLDMINQAERRKISY